MVARIIEREGDEVTIAVKVNVTGPMLHVEEAILTATNELGAVATVEALKQFDADGDRCRREHWRNPSSSEPVRRNSS